MPDRRCDIFRAGEAWLIKSGEVQCGPHPSAEDAIRHATEFARSRPDGTQVAIYLWDRAFPELVTPQAR